MQNSKLVHIILQLTKRECQIIGQSLTAPLLEGKKHHFLLLDYISKNAKKLNHLSRSELNNEVYKSKITDAQMRLRMSELYRIISLAMVMLSAKEDSLYQDQILLDRFKHVDDEKLFGNQFSASKRRLRNYEFRNVDYLELKYELGFKEYEHISSSIRTIDLNLQELLDDVDQIFISKKLRQACFAMAHNSVYGQEYDYGLLDTILQHIESRNMTNIPSIRLYYSGFKMLSNPKETEYFNTFKQDIDELKHLFPDVELQGIYRFAINQCIRLLNRGHIEYGSITLDLYEEALENKYLLIQGHLSRFTYRNIAAIAVKVGEYGRAETFTKENKSALKKEEQESAYHFNLALISYHKRDFDTALRSLQIVDFKDHLFNLAAKVIQMKVYYESDDLDLLESHLDAMQMYLLRKKVIGYHKTNYKNIVKMTRKLLKANGNRTLIANLTQEIEDLEVLTEKKWLITQLDNR